MRDVWARLEARLGDRLALRPPATERAIRDAEAELGDAGTLVSTAEELRCLSPRANQPISPLAYFSRACGRRARSPRPRSPRG